MSAVVNIAKALETLLNEAELSQPIQVKRFYNPTFALRDVQDTVQVAIAPESTDESPQDRESWQQDCVLQIGVLRAVAPVQDDLSEVDDLVDLVREIITVMKGNRDLADGTLMAVANDPIYDTELLGERHQFVSVILATYRLSLEE